MSVYWDCDEAAWVRSPEAERMDPDVPPQRAGLDEAEEADVLST